jgi:hypothetical protein
MNRAGRKCLPHDFLDNRLRFSYRLIQHDTLGYEIHILCI